MQQRKPGKTKGRMLDSTLRAFAGKPGSLLGILEALQRKDPHNHLDEATLRQVARKAGIPLSQVYSVATFYAFFNLTPQGAHTIVVCRGTACHTRGSRALLEELPARLGGEGGGDEGAFTTPDKRFTVRTVACFGQCALAPVVAIDGTIHAHMTVARLLGLVARLRKEAAR